MDDKTKQALKDIVGPDNYTDKLIDLVSYASDASEHRHRPDAAMWPTSAQQSGVTLLPVDLQSGQMAVHHSG